MDVCEKKINKLLILTEMIHNFSCEKNYETLVIIWTIWTMLELQIWCSALASQEFYRYSKLLQRERILVVVTEGCQCQSHAFFFLIE